MMIRAYDLIKEVLEFDKYKSQFVGRIVGGDLSVLTQLGIVYTPYYNHHLLVKKNQCVCNIFSSEAGVRDVVIHRPGQRRRVHILLRKWWREAYRITEVFDEFRRDPDEFLG